MAAKSDKDDDKVAAPVTEKGPGDVRLGGAGQKATETERDTTVDATPKDAGGGSGPGLTGAGTVRSADTGAESPPEPGTVVVHPPGHSPPAVDARGQPNEALVEETEKEEEKPRDGGYQSPTG